MIVTLAVITPTLALAFAEILRTRTQVAGRICAAGAALAFALAVLLFAMTLVQAGGASPHGWLGMQSGRLPAAMLLLVLGVSALVQSYALRNLDGAPTQRRFISTAALTTSAVALTVSAAHLVLLLIGWELTSLGLLAIVGQRRDLSIAREGMRRAARSLLVGDAALLLAGALIWRGAGDVSLAHLHRVALILAHERLPGSLSGLLVGPSVAVLLVIAAAARASQLPGQSWLAATVATPTPASAMLHAGLVNAGGFLLVRLAPVFAAGPAGPTLAVTLGLATAVYGGVLSLTRPDVKSGLAHSTSAQMGFMLIACGLGAYAAAIVHLIGHGLYKASVFLSADGTLAANTAKRTAPVPAPSTSSLLAIVLQAGLVCAGAMAAALLSFAHAALEDPGAIVPIAFAWAAAVTLSVSLLRGSHLRRGAILLCGGIACLAYPALLATFTAYLRIDTGAAAYSLPLVAALPVIGACFLAMLALTASDALGLDPLRLALYPMLLELGSVRARVAVRRQLLGRARPWATRPVRLSERSAAA